MDTFFAKNTVDILINNTQGPAAGSALEKGIEECQTAFDLLFKCAVYTSNLALTAMQKNSWGRIINVASLLGDALRNITQEKSVSTLFD